VARKGGAVWEEISPLRGSGSPFLFVLQRFRRYAPWSNADYRLNTHQVQLEEKYFELPWET